MKNSIFFLFCIIGLYSCANDQASKSSLSVKMPSDKQIVEEAEYDFDLKEQEETSSKVFAAPSLQDRQLIKTADYRMQVEKVDNSTSNIQAITQEMGGIISNMDFTSTVHQVENNLSILVPNQHFEILLIELSKEAVFVNQKQINTTDVSEEFVDLQARLKTKKEVRDRYTDLLRKKASSIQEVFEAEEKIRVLQEEIESKEGRLKYLQEKVSHSQINLVIYETVLEKEEPTVYQASIGKQFKANLWNGWEIILNIFLAMANIWPLLLLGVGLFFFKRRLFGR